MRSFALMVSSSFRIVSVAMKSMIAMTALYAFLRRFGGLSYSLPDAIVPAPMTLRSGVYIVPTNRWYIERTVWLIAGVVLLASTAMALLVNPLWILGVTATGLVSINVAFTGFCPVGSVLSMLGFTPMLGSEGTPSRWKLYFMKTDKWYLERRIYLAVGINISIASMLTLAYSLWVTTFTIFVGGAMVWFCRDGFLRDGKRTLLARRRTALKSPIDAFRPLRGMRDVGSVHQRPRETRTP